MKIFDPISNRATTPRQRAALKRATLETIRLRGTEKIPDPPRNLQPQSGARKVVLTWDVQQKANDVASFRIYRDTESNLYTELHDSFCRQVEISVTAGASPPTYNFFVSCVNAFGVESRKVMIQGKATAESGAPSDPNPPPSWTKDTSGGGGGKYSGRGANTN